MTRPSDEGRCDLCGEPMPDGESMFRMHGYSGPCPKPPLPVTTPTHCACVWHGQADGPPFSECHYHATLRADLAAAKAQTPVAWLVRSKTGKIRACWTVEPDAEQRECSEIEGDTITPLVAAIGGM